MLSLFDWLLLSILFFLAMVAWTVWYAIRKKSKLLDPVFVFLFLYCMYVLPLPLNAYIAPTYLQEGITEHLWRILPFLPFSVFLCAIGLPPFMWAYYSKWPQKIASRLPRPRGGDHSLRAFIMLLAIALTLVTILARNYGGLLMFALYGYQIAAEWVGKGYLAIGFPWLFVASMFLLYTYARTHRKTYLMLFWTAFGLVFTLHVVMGRRGDIAYMLMVLVLFWHHGVRSLSFKRLAFIGIVAFAALNLFGQIRRSQYGSLDEFVSVTEDAYSRAGNDRWYYTLSRGEFLAPYESFPEMIRTVGKSVPPRFGMTYIQSPLFFVPSALYPTRPLPLAAWYINTFYEPEGNRYFGRQFFFLGEGYLNFGPVGIILEMIFWGLLAGAMRQYHLDSGRDPGTALLYSIVVAYFLFGLHSDSPGLVVGLPSQYLFPALLGLFLCAGRKPTALLSEQEVAWPA